jgi:DnaJ domain
MQPNAAIVEALHLFRQPARARSIHKHSLPLDMLSLIKIAAGDPATTDDWAKTCGESHEVMQQAARFFLQQLITKAGGDCYRTLGLTPQSTQEDIRNHKRWLLKWLHPDRNHSKWESAMFHRISQIAQDLEAQKRSARLDILASPQETVVLHKRTRERLSRSVPQKHTFVRKIDWRSILLRIWRRVLRAAVLAFAVGMLGYLLVGADLSKLQAYGF